MIQGWGGVCGRKAQPRVVPPNGGFGMVGWVSGSRLVDSILDKVGVHREKNKKKGKNGKEEDEEGKEDKEEGKRGWYRPSCKGWCGLCRPRSRPDSWLGLSE